MEQRKSLFGQNIMPACEYCAKSHVVQGNVPLYCDATGKTVPEYHHCALFAYDPLRRVPKRTPPLPDFSPEDFKL